MSIKNTEIKKSLVATLLQINRGARKLTGENLKLVWAEFSTLSQAVLMMSIYLFT
jgi:hypothetical protein